MIGAISAWLAGMGLSESISRKVAVGVLIVGVALLVAVSGALWLHFHDKGVIEADRAEANAEFRGRQVEAEREAGAAKHARDAADAAEQDEMEGMVDEAQADGRSAADDVWQWLWGDGQD